MKSISLCASRGGHLPHKARHGSLPNWNHLHRALRPRQPRERPLWKRAISPVIATVILLLMTVAAGGLAYISIIGFQEQAQSGGEGAIQQLVAQTQSQLKVESVKAGTIYIRNIGTSDVSKVKIYADGREVGNCDRVEKGDYCIIRVNQTISCGPDKECTLTVGTATGAAITGELSVDEEELEPGGIILTTFSDGSSSKIITFSGPGSDISAKIKPPTNAIVSSATLSLLGLYLTDISSSNNSTLTGDGGSFGWSISSGDINNDGYDDLLVGAYGYNSNTGRAYVFWGNSTGNFDSSRNYTINGEDTNNNFGGSVSSGDINNDGYGDILVGAPKYNGDQGRAYVFWGNSTGNFDSSRNYTITGEAILDWFGSSVLSGDINNDGYDDLLVGRQRTGAGRVYIFWGNSTGNFDSSRNYTIYRELDSDIGYSVSSGDLNNDSYEDILTSAPPDISNKGRVWVFWGNSTGNFDSNRNYTFPGEGTGNNFGESISSGDINNDGYDDFLIGANGYASNTGRAYIFWGNESGSFTNTSNYTLTGEASGNYFGRSVSSGDINNDNYLDLLVGASGSNRAYIFWGNSTGNFDSSRNYTIASGDSNFGSSVLSGDINNDNYLDLLVGAYGTNRAYIFWPTENYTTSPSLKPGSNVTTSWTYSGPFSTSQSADIKSALTSILSGNCTCFGCSVQDSDCIIDLNLTSQSAGKIQLSNLQITYTT